MMTKMIRIESCGECGDWCRVGQKLECNSAGDVIDDTRSLPEWCPLEDAPEEKKDDIPHDGPFYYREKKGD
jgi:hypothetical protein